MPIHNLTAQNADYHKGRIELLRPDSQRLWGEMDAARMMRHLRASVEASLGEGDPNLKKLLPQFAGDIVGWLFMDVFTKWPKSGRKPKESIPSFFPDPEMPFEEERRALLGAMDRFVERLAANPEEIRLHPLLGMIPLRRWARVHGVHFNHHLRQFGLASPSRF